MRAIPSLLLAATMALPSFPLHAQERDAWKPRFDLTPFVGYRSSGDFDLELPDGGTSSADVDAGASYGFDAGVYRDSTSFYEILYSRKQADIDFRTDTATDAELTTEYFHFGGTLLFPYESYAIPYLSVTIGATNLKASAPYDSEMRFSASLGGGLRLPVTDRFSAVLGLRTYLTLLDSESDIFCTGNGDLNCLVRSSGSTYFEFEGQLGFNFTF